MRRVTQNAAEVFPTPVGVFLPSFVSLTLRSRLPHARGGVSADDMRDQADVLSSPRPWGCFSPAALPDVCPRGLPHARGGVSLIVSGDFGHRVSSPRPWGCFPRRQFCTEQLSVFPTPVGVFLADIPAETGDYCLPHARGGVSPEARSAAKGQKSSPRPWGCFPVSH